MASIHQSQRLVDQIIERIPPAAGHFKGRGIVTCAGRHEYFPSAWVLIRMLRHCGCKLPIQLWYMGPGEVSKKMQRLVSKYGVECVDGLRASSNIRRSDKQDSHPSWARRSIALGGCPFEEVIYLDADNLSLLDPSFLFEVPQYKTTGALFWPHVKISRDKALERIFRVRPGQALAFEGGQIVVNKRKHWQALALVEKISFLTDKLPQVMRGNGDVLSLAWHRLGSLFAMPKFMPQTFTVHNSEVPVFCQHDFDGNRIFQHRNGHRWNLIGDNAWISGFFFENECHAFLEELKSIWDGRSEESIRQLQTPAVLREKKELLKKVWLMEVPPSIRDRILPRRNFEKNDGAGRPSIPPRIKQADVAFFQGFRDDVSRWWELRFAKNGTLCWGAGEELGYFWDIRNFGARLKLVLSGTKNSGVELRSNLDGSWKGRWTIGKIGITTTMRALEDVYPHLKTASLMHTPPTAVRNIRRQLGGEVHLRHSTLGIGDHVSAAYACTGLARTGVRVVFHTWHADWLARVTEPGLIITKKPHTHYDHNLRYDYSCELRYGISRVLWYAGGLHPLLRPAKPQVNREQRQPRLPFEKYVLLAPFSSQSSREWLEPHWIRLESLLRQASYNVVAIGSKKDNKRLERTFGGTQAFWAVNHSPEWVIDAMLGAAAYVGLDSGLTHVAALMGVKCVVIHSQLKPEFLWPLDTVKSLTPDARCVFCRGQKEGGWMASCFNACSALALVSPDSVFEAVLECVSGKGRDGCVK